MNLQNLDSLTAKKERIILSIINVVTILLVRFAGVFKYHIFYEDEIFNIEHESTGYVHLMSMCAEENSILITFAVLAIYVLLIISTIFSIKSDSLHSAAKLQMASSILSLFCVCYIFIYGIETLPTKNDLSISIIGYIFIAYNLAITICDYRMLQKLKLQKNGECKNVE